MLMQEQTHKLKIPTNAIENFRYFFSLSSSSSSFWLEVELTSQMHETINFIKMDETLFDTILVNMCRRYALEKRVVRHQFPQQK